MGIVTHPAVTGSKKVKGNYWLFPTVSFHKICWPKSFEFFDCFADNCQSLPFVGNRSLSLSGLHDKLYLAKNIMLVLFEGSYIIIFIPFLKLTLHKKWIFPLRISSVNLPKSAGNYGFGHIYRRNHEWKKSVLVQCQRKKWYICIFFTCDNILDLNLRLALKVG